MHVPRAWLSGGVEAIWGRRADGVEVGVVPFGKEHPVPAFRGRWHVQVRRSCGHPALTVSGPLSYDEAREKARSIWTTWGSGGAPSEQA